MKQNAIDQVADNLAMPRWAYIPGVDAAADRAALDAVKALVPARFEAAVPAAHPAVVFGLRLNDAGFFWEAHEILEAVWKAAPKGGLDRICLRGCIQIANANLKAKMGRAVAAGRLRAEACAEFTELGVRRPAEAATSLAATFPAAAVAERLLAVQPGETGSILLGGRQL